MEHENVEKRHRAVPARRLREGRTATMLRATGITKTFPGVKSLDRVDFAVEAGEIHALVGENGAGKSTLIKTCPAPTSPMKGSSSWTGA